MERQSLLLSGRVPSVNGSRMLDGMRSGSKALTLALSLGGCVLGDVSGGPPCDDDIVNCSDDTSGFMEDPTCTLQGEFELELGQGETSSHRHRG